MTAAEAIVAFRIKADEIARLHRQLDAGGTLHLPTYHQAIKECESAAVALVSARQIHKRPRPATSAATRPAS